MKISKRLRPCKVESMFNNYLFALFSIILISEILLLNINKNFSFVE